VKRVLNISKATVRWTVACRQLDGGNSSIFISAGNENANKSLLLRYKINPHPSG